jgi:hypothetical protein
LQCRCFQHFWDFCDRIHDWGGILKDFFEGQRLKEIPSSRKKREVVLRWLASQFERDRQYPEKELNAVIQRHHPDYATLRRELIGAELLRRDAGVYWKP